MAMLTPELVDKARKMRAAHVGWHTIQKRLGVSEYLLRAEMEPAFQKHRSAQHRRYAIEKKQIAEHKATMRARLRSNTKAEPHYVATLERAPPDVLRDRDEREAAARERATLDQIVFGDPTPGYSALDRRTRR
jgi:hypothetical protein